MGGRYGETRTGPGPILVVRVTARAVDGQATTAVRRAVAEAFGVRLRDVQVVAGSRSRTKVLQIDIPDHRGTRILDDLLGA